MEREGVRKDNIQYPQKLNIWLVYKMIIGPFFIEGPKCSKIWEYVEKWNSPCNNCDCRWKDIKDTWSNKMVHLIRNETFAII